jgi:hypothetical protein
MTQLEEIERWFQKKDRTILLLHPTKHPSEEFRKPSVVWRGRANGLQHWSESRKRWVPVGQRRFRMLSRKYPGPYAYTVL